MILTVAAVRTRVLGRRQDEPLAREMQARRSPERAFSLLLVVGCLRVRVAAEVAGFGKVLLLDLLVERNTQVRTRTGTNGLLWRHRQPPVVGISRNSAFPSYRYRGQTENRGWHGTSLFFL